LSKGRTPPNDYSRKGTAAQDARAWLASKEGQLTRPSHRGKALLRQNRAKIFSPPVRKLYRKDIIDGIGWQWEYNENGRPINAVPFCSKCGTPAQIQILKQLSGPQVASAYCPNCNKPCQQITGIDSPDDLRDVHAVPKIRQKIATDTWPRS
jgi:hypothetical protein